MSSTTWIKDLTTEEFNLDFTYILNQLNQQDGYCLQELYDKFCSFKVNPIVNPTITIDSAEKAVSASLCINYSKGLSDNNGKFTSKNLDKLVSLGLLFSKDNVHYGLTVLGLSLLKQVRG